VRHETDTGPIIAQAAVPVLPGDDESALAARVLRAEHRLYPLALRLIAEGKVRMDGDRALITDAAFAESALFNPAIL
jgi:phosphoribosylglycinamide formyltransferase-1